MTASLAEAMNQARAHDLDAEALGQVLEASPLATVAIRAYSTQVCLFQAQGHQNAQSGLVGTHSQ
jgi:hypothetical protein